jgi:hypothetical protein
MSRGGITCWHHCSNVPERTDGDLSSCCDQMLTSSSGKYAHEDIRGADRQPEAVIISRPIEKTCQLTALEPRSILLPGMHNNVSTNGSYRLNFLLRSPSWKHRGCTHQMCSDLKGCSESEIIVDIPIPFDKASNHPKSCLDQFVKPQGIHLSNHCSNIASWKTHLHRFEVNNE